MSLSTPSWSHWSRIALLSLVVATAPSCGEGTISFGGDDDDDDVATVTVEGNLDDISPVTTRDIVVFVYNVDEEDGEQCPCPSFPVDTSRGKAAVIESGETAFDLSGLDSGAIRVLFLLDNAGDAADGQIDLDEGDLIAILDDDDCELDDIDGNLTVTLEDIDIEFSAAPVSACEDGNPPAPGRARADQITQRRTAEP